MKINMPVSGNERSLEGGKDLITTTDAKGSITFYNDNFFKISGFPPEELMHKNHNVVRHPDMPPAAFEDLWTTTKAGKSWMGIVKNRSKNGDHYYVDAYVTPIKKDGVVKEYQSVRTVPDRKAVNRAEKFYARLRAGKKAFNRYLQAGLFTRLLAGFTMLLTAAMVFSVSMGVSIMHAAMAWGVGLILSYGLIHYLMTPLRQLASETRQVINNDLACMVYTGRLDEIGQVRLALHMRKLEVNSAISRLNESMHDLESIVNKTTRMGQESNQGVAAQKHEIEQLATAINEMSSTVQEVARNTNDAADAAQKANKEVKQGKDVVSIAVHSINDVAEKVNGANKVVQDLQQQSENIGAVLDVIRSIAEQTNLLALNAAIEAARAGEQGRGFAVVADEVRSLASRTQESTQEIQDMIETIRESARNAVHAMDTGCQQVGASVEQARSAGETLDSIASMVSVISDMNLQIASAAEEQSSVTEEINRNVVNINNAADENAARSDETGKTINDLAAFASYLRALVTQFRSRSA